MRGRLPPPMLHGGAAADGQAEVEPSPTWRPGTEPVGGGTGSVGLAPWDLDSTQPSVGYAPSLSPRSSYSVGAASAAEVAAMAGQGKEILEALRSLTKKLDGVSLLQQGGAQASPPPAGEPSLPAAKCGYGGAEASAPAKRGREDQEAILGEMYRELEGLELALAKERHRVAALADEKAASETAHSRDIAALEGMLQQVMEERDRLKAQGERLLDENARLREENRNLALRNRPAYVGSLADLKEVDAPVQYGAGGPTITEEPEVERSVIDSDRCSCQSGSSR